MSERTLTERRADVANELAAWIDRQPIVTDANGDPTISPVYGAHALLCSLIHELEVVEQERDALKAQLAAFPSSPAEKAT